MQKEHDTKHFLESSHDVFCIIAASGRFSYVSSSATKLLRVGDKDLASISIFDLMSPLDIERTRSAIQKALTGEESSIDNRFGEESKGSVRNGANLLAGILFCGRCGPSLSASFAIAGA